MKNQYTENWDNFLNMIIETGINKNVTKEYEPYNFGHVSVILMSIVDAYAKMNEYEKELFAEFLECKYKRMRKDEVSGDE